MFAQFVSHQLCKCQGLVSSGKKTWKRLGRLHSLKLTQPLKLCLPKRKPDRLPTINFQVRAISFREGTLQEPKPQNSHEKRIVLQENEWTRTFPITRHNFNHFYRRERKRVRTFAGFMQAECPHLQALFLGGGDVVESRKQNIQRTLLS